MPGAREEHAELRAAGPDDLPAIRRIAEAAYQPYVARIGRKPAPMVADFAAHLARGEVWVIGAPVRGYLVGYPQGTDWQVENVALDPASQGQGLGRALMDYAARLGRRAGFARLTLYTNAKMTENIGWYDRLGFQVVDRREEDGFARVYFARSLGPGGKG